MTQLSIPLSLLAALSGAKDWTALSLSEIEQQVRAAFTFLGSAIEVVIEGGIAHIKYLPPKKAKQEEAVRLMERAEKRAQAGEYTRAVELYERLLKLDPSVQPAWRNLAMARMELGRNDEARDALIDALRLDPRDAWSYVVLANIYAKHRREYAQARTFYERALELKPDDPWALNGLAAAMVEMGDSAAGLKTFDRAIAVAPSFANAWCGKALVLVRDQNGPEAAAVLDTMFRQASTADVRSGAVFQEARRLYVSTQELIATATESEAFKAVEDYRAAAERESGFPVKVEEGDLPARIAASAQMAWKHSRDHHRIVLRKSPPPSGLRNRAISLRTS